MGKREMVSLLFTVEESTITKARFVSELKRERDQKEVNDGGKKDQ